MDGTMKIGVCGFWAKCRSNGRRFGKIGEIGIYVVWM